MKLFGLEITRAKAVGNNVSAVHSERGWFSLIREPWGGAWQGNVTLDAPQNLLAFSAVFSCVTGIASDIAKLCLRVVEEKNGICTPIPYASPRAAIFRRFNHYQNRIKFIEQWVVSKLLYGNAYALKERDGRNMVRALYLLHPDRVTPLVTDAGDVYYRVSTDNLSRVPEVVTVPASEMIHDMMVSLWHPLAGVSPIYACAMAGTMANKIQANSAAFFGNMSRPSGLLSADGPMSEETASRLKKDFEDKFSGSNVGRIAVGGDGLKYFPFTIPASDSQLIEQLKWTVDDVGRTFHYPLYKLGGAIPPGTSIEQLNQGYYSECLQPIIEPLELCLTEGVELPPDHYAEFDLDGLLRMDQGALAKSEAELVSGAIKTPNEARKRFNLPGVRGGDSVYLQQQNYSTEALAKRDAQDDPFKTGTSAAPPAAAAANDPSAEEAAAAQAREIIAAFTKGLEHA